MITKELVERFLRNECTLAERRVVLDHFSRHPEEWDQYLDEEDWEQFEQLADYDAEHEAEMYDHVKAQTVDRRRHRLRRIGWLSAAAALLLVIAGWWMLRDTHDQEQPSVAVVTAPSAPVQQTLHHESNTGSAMRVLTLWDGSTVELAPNSSIDYPADQVTTSTRIVYVTGKASFRVVRDRSRPFTVYSGDIGTTVLGTYFTVEAFVGASETRVSLHEGRVVVKATDNALHRLAKAEYLFPGDVLVFRRMTGLATITRAAGESRLAKAAPMAPIPGARRPDWFQFNGQSLTEVLDQLSTYYQVTIYYYPTQLRNRYFTCRIEQTDSLENLLNDIALLNHLTIRKQGDNSYLITTKSH